MGEFIVHIRFFLNTGISVLKVFRNFTKAALILILCGDLFRKFGCPCQFSFHILDIYIHKFVLHIATCYQVDSVLSFFGSWCIDQHLPLLHLILLQCAFWDCRKLCVVGYSIPLSNIYLYATLFCPYIELHVCRCKSKYLLNQFSISVVFIRPFVSN